MPQLPQSIVPQCAYAYSRVGIAPFPGIVDPDFAEWSIFEQENALARLLQPIAHTLKLENYRPTHFANGDYADVYDWDGKYAIRVEDNDRIEILAHSARMHARMHGAGFAPPLYYVLFDRDTYLSAMIMGRVDGTLEDLLQSAHTDDQLQNLFSQVMAFILRFHQAGFVHGDLHPGNIGYRRINGKLEFALLDFEWCSERIEFQDIDCIQLFRVLLKIYAKHKFTQFMRVFFSETYDLPTDTDLDFAAVDRLWNTRMSQYTHVDVIEAEEVEVDAVEQPAQKRQKI